MTILQKLLHSEAKGAARSEEDHWFLSYDTEQCALYVEHIGLHRDPSGDYQVDARVMLEVSSYLTANPDGPGQRRLERTLRGMFENGTR